MCLYPKLIKNKKNGGMPPACPDERLRYVTAACGDCLECRQQKQRAWKVRMNEELRQEPNAYFLTLTITDENYAILNSNELFIYVSAFDRLGNLQLGFFTSSISPNYRRYDLPAGPQNLVNGGKDIKRQKKYGNLTNNVKNK